MRLCDRETVEKREQAAMALGVEEPELMRRASEALANAVDELLGGASGRRVVVFCGRGKNGGDGYGAAQFLRMRGASVTAVDVGDGDIAPLCHLMREQFEASGGDVRAFSDIDDAMLRGADAIVDAMFGVGFHGELSGRALDAAKMINDAPVKVISADLPSGVECDSALAAENTVKADLTVAFGCAKPAHFVQPAKSYCGRVIVANIGISGEIEAKFCPNTQLIDEHFVAERLKPRSRDTHKGDYGKLLIVGGSMGYTGAPCLATEGALRSGVGIAFLAAPECVYPIVATAAAREAVCLPMPSTDRGYSKKALEPLIERSKSCDALLLGPGLGRSDESDRVAFELIRRAECPLILDADGINAVSENIDILRERSVPTVVTPHDVEFRRLGGELGGGRIAGAAALAERLGAVVVLKGNSTVVAAPDGRVAVNSTGNPGMATGGSGDVLAGVIASLAAQGMEPFDAAAVGVWLHGRAGDIAAAELGEYGMLPSDLAGRLPYAIKPFGSRD